MSEIRDFQALVLVLLGLATAVIGWLYSRRLGVAAAQKALHESNQSLISNMNVELRLRDSRLEDIERRLKDCEKRRDAEKRLRLAARRRSELIG